MVKIKGITYISDEYIALIKYGLNLKEDNLNCLKYSFKVWKDEVSISIDNK